MLETFHPKMRWIMFLAIYGLFFLTGLAALLVQIGWLDRALPGFKSWSLTVLLSDIAGTAIAAFSQAFFLRSPRITIAIEFENAQGSVDLDPTACKYTVQGIDGTVTSGPLQVSLGPGGWSAVFSANLRAEDVVRLTLSDRQDKEWVVRNFSPFSHSVTAS